MARRGTVVIGVGNVICQDDGLGVRALERLRRRHRLPADVRLVEGGTAGLLLLPYLAEADRVILVDAVEFDAPAGTLVRLDGAEVVGSLAGGGTVHELGAVDLLRAARFSGAWPRRLTLLGMRPDRTGIGTDLSPAVDAALDRLADRIAAELADGVAASADIVAADTGGFDAEGD